MVRPGLPSLPEVHASVSTSQPSLWRRMFAFAGPAYVVSVGYMDPGNWATDLEGGARFGYQLLWVLVVSNAMAILLQTLSARLGIVAGRDLAQACREAYPTPVSYALWILCEVAIAACDLAEVLGAAIGLNLLFQLPLLAGVLLMSLDTLLILWFSRFGIRWIEALILSMVTIIGGCFAIEIFFAKPNLAELATGLVPRLNGESLYVAIGILGATVMPHNLYLHGALVQTRRFGASPAEKRSACRFNLIDSVIALNGALFVNGAILVLAASTFFKRNVVVTEIQQAHELLTPLLGTTFASVLFAVALLASGQSSTVTGTMAGQIVMEGFLNFRMRPWLRRLITRMLAIVPAAITVAVAGEQGTYKLLILSQVILSMQLPFAVIPLIQFTSDRQRMGEFTSPAWVRLLAWLAALVIVGLNVWLVIQTFGSWLGAAGEWRWVVGLIIIPFGSALAVLLAYVAFHPVLPEPWRQLGKALKVTPPVTVSQTLHPPTYRSILVPLDHTERDRDAVAHSAALARGHGAKLLLMHVEEGVTSQIYGAEASTEEVLSGERYFEGIASALSDQGIEVELIVRFSGKPSQEIVRVANDLRPDLVVMAAHGHKWWKDIILGTTINAVRHELKIPVLIVRNH
ncbi:MAG: Nramp family divalent metal transporter [Bryobacterales bacterium]|nr:Nramp family divalent metal transporter [Bryobacterales bacterium]